MIIKDAICWPTVEKSIMARIQELHMTLEAAKMESVPLIQGQIAGLRWLLIEAEPPTQGPPNHV